MERFRPLFQPKAASAVGHLALCEFLALVFYLDDIVPHAADPAMIAQQLRAALDPSGEPPHGNGAAALRELTQTVRRMAQVQNVSDLEFQARLLATIESFVERTRIIRQRTLQPDDYYRLRPYSEP